LLGELLAEVRESQAAEELSTRDEALELVRKELEKRQAARPVEIMQPNQIDRNR
jgi:chaperonin cofactor prefoldin